MTGAEQCVIEVGHPTDRTATWRDKNTDMTVCDRHRHQYDERPDLGPFSWVPIDQGEGERDGREEAHVLGVRL